MKRNRSDNLTHEEISAHAHDIWEQSGRPDGQADVHWIRAEQELGKERDQAERFAKSASPSKNEASTERSSPERRLQPPEQFG
jgi:hypothetical protein